MIPELMCTYQGVRNVSFSENSAYVLNGWFLIDGNKGVWKSVTQLSWIINLQKLNLV